MAHPPTIEVFDSSGEPYRKAFQTFLAHTDQKAKAMVWLEQEIRGLSRRETLIDAGAGNGKLTAALQHFFPNRIAIEPNASLREDLVAACPGVRVIGETVSQAEPDALADFILCSHVFYYIDRSEWDATIRRLASWLRPEGVLAVAIQNHETDCMRMLRHFTGEQFDLSPVAEGFRQEFSDRFDVRQDLVEAYVTTEGFAPAYDVAEFMLNLVPLRAVPPRDAVEQYVASRFAQGDNRYRFSCHQEFLRIQRLP